MAPLLLLASAPRLPPPPHHRKPVPTSSSSPPFLLLPFRPASSTNSFRFSLLHPSRAALTSQDGSTASASTSKSHTPLPHPLSSSFGSRKRFHTLVAEALIGCVLVAITVAPLLQAEIPVAAAEIEEAKNLGSSVAAAFVERTAKEPANALSVPTWTIHVASVAEWVTAMVLVWQYGQITGNESWKGLSWGMVCIMYLCSLLPVHVLVYVLLYFQICHAIIHFQLATIIYSRICACIL
ncbi:hypothetical protein O6H91_12G087300 [Diphasiastrum complanatum]|uniref:Uncharacterized protein n=1 Tax=Diphasiastrum complanatum TaxID=34168 RepID=A0ACC2C4J6_DIPCM|nr:hypothetical protein O6H91_12G087300 [Diphasiastrum complanatum]